MIEDHYVCVVDDATLKGKQMIKKFQILIFPFIFVFNLSPAAAQSSNDKRLMTSMTQVTTALSIQRGIKNDSSCSNKNYKSIPLDDYVNLVASIDEKENKKTATKAEKEEIKKVISSV